MQKNMDSFFSDLPSAIQSSSDPRVSSLFPVVSEADSRKRPASVATQFKVFVYGKYNY